MNKTTIIYAGAFRLPAGNAAAQRVRANAKILRDLGYRVILVGVEDSPTSRRVIRRGSYVRDGFHSLNINVGSGAAKLWRRLSAATMLRIIRMRSGKKVVICYNYASLGQMQLQLYCRMRGITFGIDVTEWYGGDGGNPVVDVARWIDTTLRMRVLNPLADAFITTSPFLSQFYGGRSRPLVELPTLFDRAEVGEIKATAANHGPIRLVYAGLPFNLRARRPLPHKMKERIDQIVDLIARVNENGTLYTLDLYGPARQDFLRAFPSYAPTVEASPWLRFHGGVSHEEILRVVKEADFTVFFRARTRVNLAGFPVKFSESLACGTPVITNPMENIARFAVDGQNAVLLEITDLAASAARLRALAGDRQGVRAAKEYCARTNVLDYREWVEVTRPFAEAAFGGPGRN